jgi:hypothetical protein
MRLLEKEPKPVKLLFRDTLVVYISVIIAYYIRDQLSSLVTSGGVKNGQTPSVFTDNPGF